jgi:iron-sulfur cluster repair protein YtfE (RIC family)
MAALGNQVESRSQPGNSQYRPSSKKERKLDPFKLLKKDHDAFKAHFREYEKAGDRAYRTKEDIANTVFEELSAHERIEEEVFYPAVREGASKAGQEIVLEGYEEHHVADLLIEELKAMGVEEENYDAKFKVLVENVEHHMQEEEEEMFPEARKALADNAEEVGRRMKELKEALLAPAPR